MLNHLSKTLSILVTALLLQLFAPQPHEMKKDIVDVAVENSSFTALVAAAGTASGGSGGPLKGDGPFTVFAPTDEAFAALPEGTVEILLKTGKQRQASLLTYHVVPGKIMAAGEVMKLSSARNSARNWGRNGSNWRRKCNDQYS